MIQPWYYKGSFFTIPSIWLPQILSHRTIYLLRWTMQERITRTITPSSQMLLVRTTTAHLNETLTIYFWIILNALTHKLDNLWNLNTPDVWATHEEKKSITGWGRIPTITCQLCCPNKIDTQVHMLIKCNNHNIDNVSVVCHYQKASH